MIHLFTWDPGWIRPLRTGTERLFYDGHCGLCQRSVRLILAEDATGSAFRSIWCGSAGSARMWRPALSTPAIWCRAPTHPRGWGSRRPPQRFALTSGTTAGRKFIPVTQQYLDDYRRGWNPPRRDQVTGLTQNLGSRDPKIAVEATCRRPSETETFLPAAAREALPASLQTARSLDSRPHARRSAKPLGQPPPPPRNEDGSQRVRPTASEVWPGSWAARGREPPTTRPKPAYPPSNVPRCNGQIAPSTP